MKVLLYVPEPIGRYMSAGLIDEGWEFVWTDDPVSAIREAGHCHAMIVDCGLIPKSAIGLELPTNRIPTVLLDNPGHARTNGCSADAVLVKPFRFQQLLDALVRVAGKSGGETKTNSSSGEGSLAIGNNQ